MFAAYNLFFGLRMGVDNAAHIGGLAGGLALGAFFSRHLMEPPEERQRWRTYGAIGTLALLTVAMYYLRKEYRPLTR
jgi:rhomboid protease GluP